MELTQQVPTSSLGCPVKNSVRFFLKACGAPSLHPGTMGLGYFMSDVTLTLVLLV